MCLGCSRRREGQRADQAGENKLHGDLFFGGRGEVGPHTKEVYLPGVGTLSKGTFPIDLRTSVRVPKTPGSQQFSTIIEKAGRFRTEFPAGGSVPG